MSFWPHGLHAACQVSPIITNSRSLLKLISIESVMPSNHLILCPPLLLLPSIFPSNRVFSSESVLWIRWPMYWSFSFSISLSNEHPGLISFRMDWLHLLAVQGTLKSLLQHHSSKASILRCSANIVIFAYCHICFYFNLKKHWKIYETTAQNFSISGKQLRCPSRIKGFRFGLTPWDHKELDTT